jgi:hypothetical protein
MMYKPTMVAATAATALALPVAATAAVSGSTAHRYQADYHAVAHKFGPRAPGRNIIKWGLPSGHRAKNADVLRSIAVLERMLHPAPVLHIRYTPAPASAPAPAAPSTSAASGTTSAAPAAPTATSSGGYGSVPGVPASFAACVARRESSDGAGSSNIYGIIPASGYSVAGMSGAEQKAVFSQMYAKYGASTWHLTTAARPGPCPVGSH